MSKKVLTRITLVAAAAAAVSIPLVAQAPALAGARSEQTPNSPQATAAPAPQVSPTPAGVMRVADLTPGAAATAQPAAAAAPAATPTPATKPIIVVPAVPASTAPSLAAALPSTAAPLVTGATAAVPPAPAATTTAAGNAAPTAAPPATAPAAVPAPDHDPRPDSSPLASTTAPAAPATRPASAAAPVIRDAGGKPTDPDKVVITVGGEKLTAGDVDAFISDLPPDQQSVVRSEGRRGLADYLVKTELLAQEAKSRRLNEDPRVQRQMRLVEDQVLARALISDVRDGIDDATVRKFFEEHRASLERVHARHVLVRTPGSKVSLRPGQKELTEDQARAKALDIYNRLKSGADFAKVAREESDDTGSGTGGGDLGSVSRGRTVEPFEKAAFALKEGEIGQPVRSPFGWHVIQVLERFDTPEKLAEQIRTAVGPAQDAGPDPGAGAGAQGGRGRRVLRPAGAGAAGGGRGGSWGDGCAGDAAYRGGAAVGNCTLRRRGGERARIRVHPDLPAPSPFFSSPEGREKRRCTNARETAERNGKRAGGR